MDGNSMGGPEVSTSQYVSSAPTPHPHDPGVQLWGSWHIYHSPILPLPGPRVPSSLITWPSLPPFCSQSDPSPISTWTHCLPQLQPWQQLLFTHQVSPHPKIHFWFQSCRLRGSEFQASRIGLPAPLLPSPTRLRTDRHKESKGRSGEEGGAGTERDTA